MWPIFLKLVKENPIKEINQKYCLFTDLLRKIQMDYKLLSATVYAYEHFIIYVFKQ